MNVAEAVKQSVLIATERPTSSVQNAMGPAATTAKIKAKLPVASAQGRVASSAKVAMGLA